MQVFFHQQASVIWLHASALSAVWNRCAAMADWQQVVSHCSGVSHSAVTLRCTWWRVQLSSVCSSLKVTRLSFFFSSTYVPTHLLIHSNQFYLSSRLKQPFIYSSTWTTCSTTYVPIYAFTHTWFFQSLILSVRLSIYLSYFPFIYHTMATINLLLLLLLLSLSLSHLCRVFIHIFLRQKMSLRNTMLQLFCRYCLWCPYH
jgi:hypothetical protein